MTLPEAKKLSDRIMASLFFDRMKDLNANDPNAGRIYKTAADEMSELLLHMKSRVEILFGQDPEALQNFLLNSGIQSDSKPELHLVESEPSPE